MSAAASRLSNPWRSSSFLAGGALLLLVDEREGRAATAKE